MKSDGRPLERITTTRAQQILASWMKDVLVYIVVLNLFVEYVDVIVIDSFTISIFTAILLKGLLDIIMGLEHRVAHYFEQWSGPVSTVLRIIVSWLILFASKFVILEVVDFVFGDHVELGGFVTVLILVLVMMIARQIVNRVYVNLGPSQSAAAEST